MELIEIYLGFGLILCALMLFCISAYTAIWIALTSLEVIIYALTYLLKGIRLSLEGIYGKKPDRTEKRQVSISVAKFKGDIVVLGMLCAILAIPLWPFLISPFRDLANRLRSEISSNPL